MTDVFSLYYSMFIKALRTSVWSAGQHVVNSSTIVLHGHQNDIALSPNNLINTGGH